jgi:peroxiredoxin
MASCAQGHISVICGLPDMGKVCEEHVKGYLDQAEALKDEGVKKVMILAVDKAPVVDKWLREKYGDASSSVLALGDDNGAFTRMLGVNINDPDRPQKTQR